MCVKHLGRYDAFALTEVKTGEIEVLDFSESASSRECVERTIGEYVAPTYVGGAKSRDYSALVERLVRMGHESPFEFIRCGWERDDNARALGIEEVIKRWNPTIGDILKRKVLTVKVSTSIVVARQWVRHRTFSFAERSRRYVSGERKPFSFYFPAEAGNKAIVKDIIGDVYDYAVDGYAELRESGVKAESARFVIPVGVETEFLVQGTVEAWFNFLALRTDKHAQADIRVIAELIVDVINTLPDLEGFREELINYAPTYVLKAPPEFRPAREKLVKAFLRRLGLGW